MPYTLVIEKLANEYGVVWVDLSRTIAEEDVSLDGIHPLASGHEKIYQKIKKVVS